MAEVAPVAAPGLARQAATPERLSAEDRERVALPWLSNDEAAQPPAHRAWRSALAQRRRQPPTPPLRRASAGARPVHASGARRLRLSTLGLMQFMVPTMLFLLSVFVFGEEMRQIQLYAFRWLSWNRI